MKKNIVLISLVALAPFFLDSCSSVKNTIGKQNADLSSYTSRDLQSKMHTESAPEWAEMLRHKEGWIGADGIYSIGMNGVEKPGQANETNTMFWFSDCITGRIVADTLQDGWDLLHNSVAIVNRSNPNPDSIQFYYRKDNAGHSISMFEPHTPKSAPGNYYWLGDGLFNHALDSTIYIFSYLVKTVPGGIYPFDDVGLSLIAIPKGSKPPYTDQRQYDTPFFLKDSQGRGKVVFGIAVLSNTVGAGAPKPDGYIYVYGVRGSKKELLLSRVKDVDFEKFSEWRFWDGAGWNESIHAAAALTDRISNEMSVSFMEDGRVLAVYQLDTNSPNVMVQAAETPYGPFQPAKKIWETPEVFDSIDFYTYNAKAHPHLSKPGELLISYNVNSFNFLDQIVKHPFHLRPRFIRLKY